MTSEPDLPSAVASGLFEGMAAADASNASTERSPASSACKRCLDLVVAIPALLVTFPIILAAMALVWLVDPGAVLFRQLRVGRGGIGFMMLKIRTMYENNDDSRFRDYNTQELLGRAAPASNGLFRLEHDTRVIPLGRFLRRYAIDELPQLMNVIRGDMSLVGPRPLQPWEVEHLSAAERRRHDVPPGITGLWQVSGQNRLSMREMLELDLAYVDRRSLGLDLKIISRTLPAVLRNDTC